VVFPPLSVGQTLDEREEVGEGFPATGYRLDDYVFVSEEEGDRARLDGRHALEGEGL